MKRWLLRIGLGLLAGLGLLYAFVFVRSVIPATVNDEGLRLERASLPAGSNAFEVLKMAASHIWLPAEVYDLLGGTNWDEALASTVLASNRETLAGWDAAVKLQDIQVPEAIKAEDWMGYLADWKRLAQLAVLRENSLLHNGQDQAAFDQILNQVRLGQRMQNSRGVLIVYLVGTAVENMGVYQMRRWVGKTHFTPDELKDYIRRLQSLPAATSAAFANTIKAEYRWQTGQLEDRRQRGEFINPASGKNYPHPMRWLPIFSFSQTKSLFAQGALMLVNAAPHHYCETHIAEMESRPALTLVALSGNWTGQILYYAMVPALANSLAIKSRNDTQLQATRTILALRAYQLTHGKLPADLNTLVPEFLEAVPVDDFDGKPLRYSAGKKIVYSVGKNLKDDGGDDRGSDAPELQRHLDLVFKFDF